ncbi:MAG: hypothetical protein GKR89_22245 [Candidatus Latescibacteria bacterium]|nr:hypothetical protein [Candidatus Latescibacterota bacterium]
MAEKKYRVAIAGGAGTWGRFYTSAFAAHPEVEIVALVDRATERGRAFAAHFGIDQVFSSIDELLAREIPDIVSAILPVAYTRDVVIACAEAGVKVVSCEKPIDYQLARADETVRICQERGTVLGCGTALWMAPYIRQTVEWIRQGHIGALTGASIPGGLPVEVSGGGCHWLAQMLYLTGMKVEWVEGWILPPEGNYANPEATEPTQIDYPAYGRLGLSGGIVCQIPNPQRRVACETAISGENGQVWITNPRPILIQGQGPGSSPVYPEFFKEDQPETWADRTIAGLLAAVDTGAYDCRGDYYRQVLEIAIALVLSAHDNHRRIELPLTDRSHKLYPHPYRLYGGDKAGWQSIGYQGPPPSPEH